MGFTDDLTFIVKILLSHLSSLSLLPLGFEVKIPKNKAFLVPNLTDPPTLVILKTGAKSP